jgi:hypothetical protein
MRTLRKEMVFALYRGLSYLGLCYLKKALPFGADHVHHDPLSVSNLRYFMYRIWA